MNECDSIIGEIQAVLGKIDYPALKELAPILGKGKRIFVVGEGRSGLMAKSFAMRLMHLGASVYVVGETITPSIEAGDVLVAVSGSGTTKSVLFVAEKANKLGIHVIAVTTNPESELAGVAANVLHVPAATKYRHEGEAFSMQPLGSLFDQCAHILFDTICLQYASLHAVENNMAFAKHSNLE
jgi:6-phospho-3-hexuloisomerase